MHQKQNDVIFPDVPTMKSKDGLGLVEKALLERHYPAVYDQYDIYLKSWQSYLRSQRKYLRAVNSAIWDMPKNSARKINGFNNGQAAVFFENHYGELPNGRLPKRARKFC